MEAAYCFVKQLHEGPITFYAMVEFIKKCTHGHSQPSRIIVPKRLFDELLDSAEPHLICDGGERPYLRICEIPVFVKEKCPEDYIYAFYGTWSMDSDETEDELATVY